MEWISFFGPRRPINGQLIWYFGEAIGKHRAGKYVYCPDDPFDQHMIQSTICAGWCDRMDAPWWMPDEGQPTPDDPPTLYPEDYPKY